MGYTGMCLILIIRQHLSETNSVSWGKFFNTDRLSTDGSVKNRFTIPAGDSEIPCTKLTIYYTGLHELGCW